MGLPVEYPIWDSIIHWCRSVISMDIFLTRWRNKCRVLRPKFHSCSLNDGCYCCDILHRCSHRMEHEFQGYVEIHLQKRFRVQARLQKFTSMAKIHFLTVSLCAVSITLFGCFSHDPVNEIVEAPEVVTPPVVVEIPPPPPTTIECIQAGYVSDIGVMELTGNNDGVRVEQLQKNCNVPKGSAWCACFVRWWFDACGVKTTITAWSPSAHNKNNVVWKQGWKKELQAADVFTLYYVKLGRIGHTGFVDRRVNETTVETVEGNTSPGGSREGQGVYRRKRAINSLYSITRWE